MIVLLGVLLFPAEMASSVHSEVDTDGAEADQSSAQVEVAPEVAAVELEQRQQQQPMKRIVTDDGSELVVLTAADYDELVKGRTPRVADWLYDQLNDERRQRLDISEKYRSCAEALARENRLVLRYRQLLIKNRLQLEPSVDDAEENTKLPETFFALDRAGNEESELIGRSWSTGSGTAMTEASMSGTQLAHTKPSRVCQSVLESDEAVAMAPRPVFVEDAGLTSWHGHGKHSTAPAKVEKAVEDVRDPQESTQSLRRQQLVDEANDAMQTAVPTTTASSSTASRDLVQKVLEQNARLKQLLRKIVDTQGMTVREFLVSCSV